MYGWLELDRSGSPAERGAFSAAQCGLCGHFGAKFRTRTRLLAATDPSLLLLLLEGLSPEPFGRSKVCCPLTLKLTKRRAMAHPELLDAVAELQVILAGEKLLDDRLDREGLFARLGERLLASDIALAAERLSARGFPLEALRDALRAQRALEEDTRADLDALARPTGQGLALIASWLAEQLGVGVESAKPCADFGESLGRLLYVVDALHDLPRDAARKHFNPILATIGLHSPRRLAFLRARVEGLIAAHEDAFRALPLSRHAAILEGSLVTGLVDKARTGLARVGSSPLPSPSFQLDQK
jgi:hypothetical protein